MRTVFRGFFVTVAMCPCSVADGKYLLILLLLIIMVLAFPAWGYCALPSYISWLPSQTGKAVESLCLTKCRCYSDYSV